MATRKAADSRQQNNISPGRDNPFYTRRETHADTLGFGGRDTALPWYEQLSYWNDMDASWQQRIKNNPYYWQMMHLDRGIFESSSKYIARLGQIRQQFDAWNAQVYDEWYSEHYNSPFEQKSRLESAGVYDLSSIAAGESGIGQSEQAEANNAGEIAPDDFEQGFQYISTAMQAVLSCYSAGMTGALQAVELAGKKLANEQAELDNIQRDFNLRLKADEVIKTYLDLETESLAGMQSGEFDADGNIVVTATPSPDYGDTRAGRYLNDARARRIHSIDQSVSSNNLRVSKVESDASLRPDGDSDYLSQYFIKLNQLQKDYALLQAKYNKIRALADTTSEQSRLDYFNTTQSLGNGDSFGTQEAHADFELREKLREFNEFVNKMRSSLYVLSDSIFSAAAKGDFWARSACMTLGALTFQLPQQAVGSGIKMLSNAVESSKSE